MAYFAGVPRDDESRPRARWSEPPPGDPHRDVTGALHDVSNALTVLLGWVAEARATRSPEQVDRALAIVEERARVARDVARRAIGADAVIDDGEEPLDQVVASVVEALSVEAQRAGVTFVVPPRMPGVLVPMPGDASQVLTNVVAQRHRLVAARLEGHAPGRGRRRRRAHLRAGRGTGGARDAGAVRLRWRQQPRGRGRGGPASRPRRRARRGRVRLELLSDPRLHGARFALRWPRIEPTLPRAPLSAPRPAVLAGTRVLVVEDDADVASLLESALGARGATVTIARDAAELAIHSTSRHDAALVDLSPIADDVLGAVEALRRGSPGVALVFISGSAVGLPEGLEGQDIRWVRKPFEVAEIVNALADTRAAQAAEATAEVAAPVGRAR